MKHSIVTRNKINNHISFVSIQIKPESELEISAIRNSEILSSTNSERELIDNYFHFSLGLGDYSVLEVSEQKGTLFTLKIDIQTN